MTPRDWPEARVERVTTTSGAVGEIVPAGGVGGGHWAIAPEGKHLAHTGAPGEPNVVRLWNVEQSSWERRVVLPLHPSGPVGFSRDGRSIGVATEEGPIYMIGPAGGLDRVPAGPCKTITHLTGIPEGGWIVAGPGGCLARYRGGAWVRAADTGIAVPMALSHLTRGEPVVAGRTVSNRPAATVWWPAGLRKSTAEQAEPAAQAPAAQTQSSAVAVVGDVVSLKLPTSGRVAGWANLSPTLVGTIFVAMEGVPLGAYDPATGAAVGAPMPGSDGPWHPPRGAVVNLDGTEFYAIGGDGHLYGGSVAFWEADWETEIPGEADALSFLGSLGPLLVIGGPSPRLIDVSRWAAPPGPPPLEQRPWQPLELAFGNNGKALAVTYAAPSIGGTARWVALWSFDGKPPRQVGLGTLRHELSWLRFLDLGKPTSPVAVNKVGSFFAAQGPTLTQLFETSTGVRAGRAPVPAARGLAFSESDEALFVITADGKLMRSPVGAEATAEHILTSRASVRAIDRAWSRDKIAVAWGDDTQAGVDVLASESGKVLGSQMLPGQPTDVALSSNGEKALIAVADQGIFRWPGGGALIKAEGPADRFTAVAYHPRGAEATFAGRDNGLQRLNRAGKVEAMGPVAGAVRDLAYHPLGRCVAAAIGGGQVQIWGEDGPVLSMELWPGGLWAVWTERGDTMGSQALVDALRLKDPSGLSRPYLASTEVIAQVLAAACE